MADYEWTRDDRGVEMYGKDYPFDAGDKHNFEWVLKNLAELCDTFPDVATSHKAVRSEYLTVKDTDFICFKQVNEGE